MPSFYTRFKSPLGSILLTSEGKSITGLYLPGHPDYANHHRATLKPSLFKPAVKQLEEYFEGKRRRFRLTIAPAGTAFQKKVWNALRTIEHGETKTYGEIAKAIKKPGAARAVGLANQKNPISIIIPCHRVIGSNGTLTGYSGGLEAKKKLLSLEGNFLILKKKVKEIPRKNNRKRRNPKKSRD